MTPKTNPSKQRRLGFLAGLLIGRSKRPKLTDGQLHRGDFKSCTRKIGVRFSDRLRNTFRHRWLRLK